MSMQYTKAHLEDMPYAELVDVVNERVRAPGGAKLFLDMGPTVVIRIVDVLRNLIADVESQIENRKPHPRANPHEFHSWQQKAIRYREVLKENLRQFETVAREHYSVTLFDFVLLVSERLEGGDVASCSALLNEVRILPWNKTMAEILESQEEYRPAAVGA